MLQIVNSGAADAAFNMAMDEALLGFASLVGRPVLRFYGWTEAAASFGYFQRYADVAALTSLRPLVRRPTGGGIVPHDNDWTYSLVFPPEHTWHELRAVESYRAVHLWLQAAFARVGVAVEVAAEASKSQVGQCFAGHEQFDVLFHGRKIAGAAQRRTKQGLLIQGSVQPVGVRVSRNAWEKAMAEVVPVDAGRGRTTYVPDEGVMARAGELVEAKYGREEFNRKR